MFGCCAARVLFQFLAAFSPRIGYFPASFRLNSGVPCIFGVFTCESMEQALNRAGGKSGNKGAEAALTAILLDKLIDFVRNLC